MVLSLAYGSHLILIDVVQEMINLIIKEPLIVRCNPIPYLTVVKVTILVGVKLLFKLFLLIGEPLGRLILWFP